MKTYDSKTLGKVTVPNNPVTRNIAGHEITLEAGIRYRAGGPFKRQGRTIYPVGIRRITPTNVAGPAALLSTEPDVIIDGLTYDQATDLVNAFNNGVSSFEGRVW